MKIEFVSYSGEWPNLCRGILTVKLDGQEVKFGPGYEDGIDYRQFWKSGGAVTFDEDWNDTVWSGEWLLDCDKNDYPEEIRKELPALIKLFNENVAPGCCGGCV